MAGYGGGATRVNGKRRTERKKKKKKTMKKRDTLPLTVDSSGNCEWRFYRVRRVGSIVWASSSSPPKPRLLLPHHSCELVCKASASVRRLVPYVVYTGCNLSAKQAFLVFTTLSSIIIFLRDVCFGLVSFWKMSGDHEYVKTFDLSTETWIIHSRRMHCIYILCI